MEVKWIKLATDMFDNRKIRQIESIPNGYAIIVVWMKLLCLAGNTNDSGFIYFTKDIPYTDQMLSAQFNMSISTVQLALKTFEQFGMIEIVDDILHISNWEKYQNVDRLNEIREYNRINKQRYRERKKALEIEMSKDTSKDKSMTSQSCHDTDIDKDKELDKEKDKNKSIRHKYGSYQNVLITDEDYEKLKSEFSDYEERIERVSAYCASTGKTYKNYLATIRNWAKRDSEKPKQKSPAQNFHTEERGSDFYKKAAEAFYE